MNFSENSKNEAGFWKSSPHILIHLYINVYYRREFYRGFQDEQGFGVQLYHLSVSGKL